MLVLICRKCYCDEHFNASVGCYDLFETQVMNILA
jgi:hypothetical protein